jgi:hypothetical protein
MQAPPPHPPEKERRFLPGRNARSFPARFSVNALGFPRSKPKKKSPKHDFRTGDIVRAVVPAHLENPGIYVGRMAAKASGAFTITTKQRKVSDIGYRYCTRLQHTDGYSYLIK